MYCVACLRRWVYVPCQYFASTVAGMLSGSPELSVIPDAFEVGS